MLYHRTIGGRLSSHGLFERMHIDSMSKKCPASRARSGGLVQAFVDAYLMHCMDDTDRAGKGSVHSRHTPQVSQGSGQERGSGRANHSFEAIGPPISVCFF